MTPADQVRALLTRVLEGTPARDLESDRIEFKTVGRSVPDALTDLAQACMCFANADGGLIIVGVEDNVTGAAAMAGSGLDPFKTQRRIYDLTEPHLVVTVDSMRVSDTDLTVITVPRSPDVHQVAGRATERVGRACEPMSSQRIAAVVSDRRGDDWSEGSSGVAPAKVSARVEEVLRGRLATAASVEHRAWATLSLRDILKRLGLLGSNGVLKNAGATLLVGTTGARIDYTHRQTRSGELTTNERLDGPSLLAIQRVLELIDARTQRTPLLLPGGQQLFIADLPDIAVREAVVNAVMHRDYQVNAPVQIEHSETRMAVTSPGDFMVGVTPLNLLTTTSRTRNSTLASAIRALGLAEAAGVGVDRMYAAMTAVGHQPPVFDTDGTRVRASLLGGAPNAMLTLFVATLPTERRTDPDTLLVLLTLLNIRAVNAAMMAPMLQRHVDEVETILRQLEAPPVSLLERTRGSATHHYGSYRLRGEALAHLGPAVGYRRRTTDDHDRKIIDVVRETGQVNGRLVRTILDVEAASASRMLGDLVARGVLVRTSIASRGPSVAYGPGPTFPNSPRRRRVTKPQPIQETLDE